METQETTTLKNWAFQKMVWQMVSFEYKLKLYEKGKKEAKAEGKPESYWTTQLVAKDLYSVLSDHTARATMYASIFSAINGCGEEYEVVYRKTLHEFRQLHPPF